VQFLSIPSFKVTTLLFRSLSSSFIDIGKTNRLVVQSDTLTSKVLCESHASSIFMFTLCQTHAAEVYRFN